MTQPANLAPDSVSRTEKPWRYYLWIAVGVSVLLRIQQFALNPAVWIDELWILRNITRKNFAELMGPLTDVQAAPPVFLWIEHALWLAFGDNIFALRLLPLVASCAMVVLLVPLGRGLVRMPALLMSILLLGLSDKLLDYTCEVKPYVVDGVVATGLAVLFRVTQTWTSHSRMILFGALAPLALFTSYASCFVYGGLMLAFLPETWTKRDQWKTWLGWAVLILSVSISFYFLYTGPIRAQRTPQMETFWQDYPDWQRPWTVPFWTVYAWGTYLERLWRPTGMILIVPLIVGVAVLWRRRLIAELMVLLAPITLAMLAAWMGKYPFEARLLIFSAPSVLLLVGEGLMEISIWVQSRQIWSTAPATRMGATRALRVVVIMALIALLIPIGRTTKNIVSVRRRAAEVWPESPSRPGPVNAGKPGVRL